MTMKSRRETGRFGAARTSVVTRDLTPRLTDPAAKTLEMEPVHLADNRRVLLAEEPAAVLVAATKVLERAQETRAAAEAILAYMAL